MGREIDHAIVAERHAFDSRLGGVLSEMDVTRGRAELLGHRFECIRGLEERGKCRRELCAVYACAPPHLAVSAARDRPRTHRVPSLYGPLCDRLGAFRRIEDRIAEADQGLRAMVL